MKTFILTAYYFIVWITMRLISVPMWNIGLPAFKYWVADTERTANQIRFATWLYIVSIIWLLTTWWIALIFAVTLSAIFTYKVWKAIKAMPIVLLVLFSCEKNSPQQIEVYISDQGTVLNVNGQTLTETDTLTLNLGQKVKYDYTHQGNTLIEFTNLGSGELIESNYSVMGKTSGKFRVR